MPYGGVGRAVTSEIAAVHQPAVFVLADQVLVDPLDGGTVPVAQHRGDECDEVEVAAAELEVTGRQRAVRPERVDVERSSYRFSEGVEHQRVRVTTQRCGEMARVRVKPWLSNAAIGPVWRNEPDTVRSSVSSG